MAIERLTAEDELMLWPDEVWPQDIGALVLLDGRPLLDADGGLRLETLTAVIESRLQLVPRFRQLLYTPPPRQGGPLWVDAASFDLRDHVHSARLRPPGNESSLLEAIERARSRRLDRSRPLWEMCFFTGLDSGHVALFVRMHHCIADGMAGIATVARFLDISSDTPRSQPEPWTPAVMPSETELVADAERQRADHRRARLASLAHPGRALHDAVASWPAVRELLAERTVPATSLNRLVGDGRRLALVRARLQAAKDVAHANGAKVNDVLLDMIAGGARTLLERRGELVDDTVVRAYVPVSLHEGDRSEARGNLIAQMVVDLPVGVRDALKRLRSIGAQTAERKALFRPALGKIPHRGFAGRMFLRLVDRQHVNLSSADLPGPEFALYFAGSRLLEVFPMVQLLGKNSLTVGAMSYAGGFNMMIVADRDAYPDLDVFVAGMHAEMHALGLDRSQVEAA